MLALTAVLSTPALATHQHIEVTQTDGRVTLFGVERRALARAHRPWAAAKRALPCRPVTDGLVAVVFWLHRDRAQPRAALWLGLAGHYADRGVPVWLYVDDSAASGSADELAETVRAGALADYATALRSAAVPTVAGRPQWPRFEPAEQHYLAGEPEMLRSRREPFPDIEADVACTQAPTRNRGRRR